MPICRNGKRQLRGVSDACADTSSLSNDEVLLELDSHGPFRICPISRSVGAPFSESM